MFKQEMLETLLRFYGIFCLSLLFIYFSNSDFTYSRNNKAIMLTKDHKVNEPSERLRLQEAGLDLHAGQSRINGIYSSLTIFTSLILNF